MAEERHICALLRQGCGGCPLLETPYPEQLRQKQARVEALLGEFGPVSPILGMEHPWHYRNKAISTFCTGPGRRLDSGIYAAGTHRVVPVASCLLHHPALDEAVEAVRQAGSAGTSPTRRTGARGLSAMCWCATAAPPDGCWWPW